MKTKYTLKIERDDFSQSPDQWGNTDIFLVYDHRQFDVRREGFHPNAIFDHLQAKEWIDKHKPETINESLETESYFEDINGNYEEYWIFGVDAYIHSGVHLSLSNTKDYPDRRWDVSTTGYILADKKEFKNEEMARNAAECLIDTWNQYISGDVWGYQIVKEITCECCNNIKEEIVDSCWGFYGEEYCKKEGESILEEYEQ